MKIDSDHKHNSNILVSRNYLSNRVEWAVEKSQASAAYKLMLWNANSNLTPNAETSIKRHVDSL